MSRKKYSSGASAVLCTVWILTAIAAVCVTFVYFGKLGKLYESVMAAEPVLVPVKVDGDGTIVEDTDSASVQTGTEAGTPSAGAASKEPLVVYDEESTETVTEAAQSQPATEDEAPVETGTDVVVEETGTPEQTENTEDYTDTGMEPAEETAVPDVEQTAARAAQVRQTPDENGKVCYFSSGRVLDPSKPMIAMTFDDGPSPRTEKILNALAEVGGRATFFVVGYQIEKYAEYVQMAYDAGCEIGNHTVGHANLIKCSEEELRHQVFDNEAAIQAIIPVDKLIVRAPYGNVNDTMKAVIDRPMFNWSVDSRDWETRDADMIVEQVQQDARDGYIILMHDIYDATMEAALRLIPWLTEQGYQLVTVSEMYELREGGVKEGRVYRYADPAT